MPINSSKKNSSRTLAENAKAHEFLRELANLRDEQAAVQRFERLWAGVFQPEVPLGLVSEWAIRGEEESVVNLPQVERQRRYWLVPLRDIVRHLWQCDPRTKQWGIFSLLERFFAVGFRDREAGPWTANTQWHQGPDLPAESSCERIFICLNDRTSVCANQDCAAPYYFPVRATQKYCSEECAAPAQRKFKRTWWNEKGPAWRTKRSPKIRGKNSGARK